MGCLEARKIWQVGLVMSNGPHGTCLGLSWAYSGILTGLTKPIDHPSTGGELPRLDALHNSRYVTRPRPIRRQDAAEA